MKDVTTNIVRFPGADYKQYTEAYQSHHGNTAGMLDESTFIFRIREGKPVNAGGSNFVPDEHFTNPARRTLTQSV